jgi:lipopolysaccharide export LptBFGC system permease protein LptF
MEMFYLLLPIFILFILWLGSKILEKAGFDKKWVFCLLIPVVNIIIIWVFAFSNWPNLKDDVGQGIN